MVVHAFGHQGNLRHEGEGLDEVVEYELARQYIVVMRGKLPLRRLAQKLSQGNLIEPTHNAAPAVGVAGRCRQGLHVFTVFPHRFLASQIDARW